MEPKSGSRTLKKSASGGALIDRKKAKQKKKKEKKKSSLKGTESTDVPSPELDSEVPLDGDVTFTDQDGQTTPAGQVTRLPHLSSQSSVSLTTLNTITATTTPPPHHSNSFVAHGKASLGGHPTSSSAPTTRSSVHAAPPSTLVTVPSAHNLDGVVARVANLNIKQRSSKNRSKATNSKSTGKSSRTRGNNNSNNGGAGGQSRASAGSGKTGSAQSVANYESLRWELAVDDVEQERERLAVYKMNRRKRYLAAAQAKGLGWAMNYNSQNSATSNTNVTPMSEDSGVETACGSPKMTTSASSISSSTTAAATAAAAAGVGAYIDFSSMQTLRPLPAHRALQEGFVEC